ncbi:MAG: hypothetical protein RL238_3222 [Actinomycetota bacterium]|jgi:hypothetical protein
MTPTRRPQTGPAVWRPSDLAPDEGVVVLTAAQRDAIVHATRRAGAAGVTVATVDRHSFPLPSMTEKLAEWVHALASGRGFLLLRDFPVDLLDDAGIELAYAGLGTHFGRPVGQNKEAELLTHVRDERLPPDAGKVRLYRTRERQDFHTDGADIIGLLCLHTALEGGESRIVSSGALYNEILRTRPDLLEALYTTMAWDRQGDVPAGELPYFMLAPINDLGGTPRVFYLGWYIRDAQVHPEVPRLTDAQLEAMELLESLANDPTFHLEMDFCPGDVQMLNNGRILHAREAYVDADDPSERRHLLRLWLAAHDFASVEAGLRGGVA